MTFCTNCWPFCPLGCPPPFRNVPSGTVARFIKNGTAPLTGPTMLAFLLPGLLVSCHAWIDPHISAGHMCLDHFAAVVSVKITMPGGVRRKKAVRIDAKALADPANHAQVEEIIRLAPRPTWATDASEHAALVVDHLYAALAGRFPASKRRLRASYLSELAGDLHKAVSGLRHRVRACKLAVRVGFAAVCFPGLARCCANISDTFCRSLALAAAYVLRVVLPAP